MKRLVKVQFFYYRQLLQKRFFYLLVLIICAQVITAIQINGNPHTTILKMFFYGTSFIDVALHHVEIPILWFCYFIVPLFIIGDAIQQLWDKHLTQLKGMQFSQLQFGIINLCFLYVTVIIYVSVTFLVFYLCNMRTWDLLLFLNVLGIVLFGSLIQSILALFNMVLGVIIPIVIFIFSIYTGFRWNIFNVVMIARRSDDFNIICMILWMGILLLTMIYLIIYRKKDL